MCTVYKQLNYKIYIIFIDLSFSNVNRLTHNFDQYSIVTSKTSWLHLTFKLLCVICWIFTFVKKLEIKNLTGWRYDWLLSQDSLDLKKGLHLQETKQVIVSPPFAGNRQCEGQTHFFKLTTLQKGMFLYIQPSL